MKHIIPAVLAAALVTTFLSAAMAETQTSNKTAVKKPVSKPVSKAKPAASKAAPVQTSNQPVADTVFTYPAATGVIACEDDVKVTISKDARRADGFDVAIGNTHYATTRVATDSGAIRLENKATGIVWLQMANKSMLFNEKAGKRLANNCRSDAQVAAEQALSTSSAPTILDSAATKKP